MSPFYNIARMIDVMTFFMKLMLIAIVLVSIMNVMIIGGLRAIREIGPSRPSAPCREVLPCSSGGVDASGSEGDPRQRRRRRRPFRSQYGQNNLRLRAAEGPFSSRRASIPSEVIVLSVSLSSFPS
jgi:hypothetical protein